ncbi:hypothetical protein PRIPAC_70072 [Pristionchus pacificus]|uniref:Uncharacterized protein n=1 Tax=Pristionchus pacificus TaxID=54126 RepID=A0A454XRH1_PRIPA|nr:hypothetical protein PRIPAC_70072 [Pristionchus pacificus]|eukprot:PDM64440.1 hypothetical protein PRIPAC_52696 [Pristionchus pacificus]
MAPTVASFLSRKKGRDSSFNDDLGSVCFAVLSFLSIGFVLFSLCFIVTKTLQCYKAHERKKKRREMGDDDDVVEITEDESSAESNDRPTILVKANGLTFAQEDERRLMRH